MTIVHFSDTHLGYNDLDIVNNDGINQREADFYDAFTQVVEQIKEIQPDYIIHTGDLFHRASPSNRAIVFAMQQFTILNSLNIPLILIAGNHSTPKTIHSSPILKIFENFENIYLSYEQKYKKIEFDDIVFHTLPHMNDETIAETQIDMCEQNINRSKKNIMMLHASVGAGYLMEEFGEWVYPKNKEYIFTKMSYVALGHWHGFGSVGKHTNVYYSGSTERTSLNDKRNQKGFVKVELSQNLNIEFKPIKIRNIKIFYIDCSDFDNSIDALNIENIDGAIVEVVLTNLTPLQSIQIQNQDIKRYFKGCMSISVKREFIDKNHNNQIDNIESISLQKAFLEQLQLDCDTNEFQRLKNKTEQLFNRYEEIYDDSI